jgi:spore coat assembly protein SafA
VGALGKLMSIPLIFILLITVVAMGTNGVGQAACGSIYTARAGDTLATIAFNCGVPYDSILVANPLISDPDHLSPGQIVAIPGAIIPITGSNPAPAVPAPAGSTTGGLRSLQIAPQSGPAGTLVAVSGSGFPAAATLTVGAGIVDSGPQVSQTIVADANGNFTTQLTIPATASAQENWSIFASQGSGNQLITVQAPFQVGAPTTASVYRVLPGDTMSAIAYRNNVTLDALISANPQISDPNLIYPGQSLQIPPPMVVIPITGQRIYIVLGGDTLSGIAHAYGTSVAALLQANPGITNPDLIYPGELIILP